MCFANGTSLWRYSACRPSPVPLLPCQTDTTGSTTIKSNTSSSTTGGSTTINNSDTSTIWMSQSQPADASSLPAGSPATSTGTGSNGSNGSNSDVNVSSASSSLPAGSEQQPAAPQPLPASCLATAVDVEDGDLSDQILVQFVEPEHEGTAGDSGSGFDYDQDGGGTTQSIPRC